VTKKTGYKVTSYNENKVGLKTDPSIVHITKAPDYIEQAFENKQLRQVAISFSPHWNSFTKRVMVYQKKGR